MPESRRKGETDEQFISRCMSEIKGEYPDQAQRYAVCKSYSEKFEREMKQEELFVLQPRKTENRGAYLARCSKHPKIKGQFQNLKERMGYCLNSFNEYYSYWSKLEEFADIPQYSALGECIAQEKSKGFDYKTAYRHCASRVGNKPLGAGGSINLGKDSPYKFAEKVSIDFDDTLSTDKGQKLAKDLISNGVDLFVVTRRNQSESSDVYKISDELGIPRNKVFFTNGKLKWEKIKELGIKEHIDNNPDEIKAIEENLKDVKAIKFQDNLLVEPVGFALVDMSIFGFKPKYFHICPGAVELFKHITSMQVDEETQGMVRAAAQVADNVFRIEEEVVNRGDATPEELFQVKLLVDDFKDIINEIDEETGMVHDVSFMDGHIKIVEDLMMYQMALEDACWEGYEAIGTKILNGKEVPNCVPIKE